MKKLLILIVLCFSVNVFGQSVGDQYCDVNNTEYMLTRTTTSMNGTHRYYLRDLYNNEIIVTGKALQLFKLEPGDVDFMPNSKYTKVRKSRIKYNKRANLGKSVAVAGAGLIISGLILNNNKLTFPGCGLLLTGCYILSYEFKI